MYPGNRATPSLRVKPDLGWRIRRPELCQGAGVHDCVGDVLPITVGAVADPDQPIHGLRLVDVVQGHHHPERGGDAPVSGQGAGQVVVPGPEVR